MSRTTKMKLQRDSMKRTITQTLHLAVAGTSLALLSACGSDHSTNLKSLRATRSDDSEKVDRIYLALREQSEPQGEAAEKMRNKYPELTNRIKINSIDVIACYGEDANKPGDFDGDPNLSLDQQKPLYVTDVDLAQRLDDSNQPQAESDNPTLLGNSGDSAQTNASQAVPDGKCEVLIGGDKKSLRFKNATQAAAAPDPKATSDLQFSTIVGCAGAPVALAGFMGKIRSAAQSSVPGLVDLVKGMKFDKALAALKTIGQKAPGKFWGGYAALAAVAGTAACFSNAGKLFSAKQKDPIQTDQARFLQHVLAVDLLASAAMMQERDGGVYNGLQEAIALESDPMDKAILQQYQASHANARLVARFNAEARLHSFAKGTEPANVEASSLNTPEGSKQVTATESYNFAQNSGALSSGGRAFTESIRSMAVEHSANGRIVRQDPQ